MTQGYFNVEKYREVEKLVQSRAIDAMNIVELVKLKVSLSINAPTAEVHEIIHRSWDRAYKEISSQIESKVAKRRFGIAIGISIVILIVGIANLVRGFIQ